MDALHAPDTRRRTAPGIASVLAASAIGLAAGAPARAHDTVPASPVVTSTTPAPGGRIDDRLPLPGGGRVVGTGVHAIGDARATPVVPPGVRGVVVITGQPVPVGVGPGVQSFTAPPGVLAAPAAPGTAGSPSAASAPAEASAPGAPGALVAPWIVPLTGIPAPLHAPMRMHPVVLFVPVDCPTCDEARAWLLGRGVPYVEALIVSPEDRASLRGWGFGTGYPALSVGARRYSGFDPSLWGRAFDQAGYPVGIPLPPRWRPPAAHPLSTWRNASPLSGPVTQVPSGYDSRGAFPQPWPVAPPMPLPRTNPVLRPPPGPGTLQSWPATPLSPDGDAAPDDTPPTAPLERPRRMRPGQGWHSGGFDGNDWPGHPQPGGWAFGPAQPGFPVPGSGPLPPELGALLPDASPAQVPPAYPPGIQPPGLYPPGAYASGVYPPGPYPNGGMTFGAVGPGVQAPGLQPPGISPPGGPGAPGWYAPPGTLLAPGGQIAHGSTFAGPGAPAGLPMKPSPGNR